MRILVFLLLTFTLNLGTSCQPNTTPTATLTDGSQQFGAPTTATDAITFDELTTQITGKDSLQTKVIGMVESVCQTKGCWVNIVSDNPANSQEMFVKFKDYAFFMPKDIAGQRVVLDGYAFRETTSVDELRHYAEDEGKSAEEIAAINQPQEELKFMASGVLLLPSR